MVYTSMVITIYPQQEDQYMARLTKSIKAKILHAIIIAANKPQSKKLLAQEHYLAEEIYWSVIGKAKRTFNKLPPSFFPQGEAIQPSIAKTGVLQDIHYATVQTTISNPYETDWNPIKINHTDTNYHNENYLYFKGRKQRPMPWKMHVCFELPTSLHKMFKAQNKINKQHVDSLQALSMKTQGLLNSVTTIKKLLQIWPDVKQYIPAAEMKSNLPAVQVKDVIALIKCAKEACCSKEQITGKGTVIAL